MAQIAKVRCNFWHELYLKIYKSHIRKRKPPLVQFEYQRRFSYEKTLFEQFCGTYTKQGDYLLPNLILSTEEETGYIGVQGHRRLNCLKHHRKVLYCNLLTSSKLHFRLADTEEQAQQLFSPAGKRTRRKRKCNRRTQINRYTALGTENG